MFRYFSTLSDHISFYKSNQDDIFIFPTTGKNKSLAVGVKLNSVVSIHLINKSVDLISLKKNSRNRFKYQQEWENFFKLLRRYYHELKSKEWDEVIPKEIANWANNEIFKLQKDLGNCIDNYRVAKIGNTCQTKRYKRQINEGCCGFMDVIRLCPIDGKRYRIGFNYGH